MSTKEQIEAYEFLEKMLKIRAEIREELEELELDLKYARTRQKRFSIWLAEKPRRKKDNPLISYSSVLWTSGPIRSYLEFFAAIALMRSFLVEQHELQEDYQDNIAVIPVFIPNTGPNL